MKAFRILIDRNSKTRVTCIMSVFNEEHRLPNAIESILMQSYQYWRLILVNDASTDNSQRVINDYVKKYKKITCIVNKRNKGLAYSLNKAIKSCNSKYIARMDADDIAFPDRLETQLKFLEGHPEIDVLGTGAEVVNVNNYKSIVLKLESHEAILNTIEKVNPFFHSSVMMRRSFIESLGGYNVEFLRAQDYDLWLRGVDRFKYHNLQEVLMTYSSSNQSFKSIYYGLRTRIINSFRRHRIVIGSLMAILVFVYALWLKLLGHLK
jgi:glycosyltransferase involved in cell wall biosynthesis